jgi:hypothetical protein
VEPAQIDPQAEDAFNLTSRPASTKKIWLDFKGGVYTNTAWNALKNLSVINIQPYNKDGDNTTFSAAELSDIVAIWRAVAEDFAPWDVDVTTIQPANLAGNTMRVSIGGDNSWYGAGGGVAYVGVFGRPDTYYQPAFVFPGNLGPNYPKYVW